MLHAFDLDGTLISGYMDNPDKAYDRWQVLPGRKARLRQLIAQGHQICIITNQAGVGMGHITAARVDRKIKSALKQLRLPEDTPVYVCMHHPRGIGKWADPEGCKRRKPYGAMIVEAMNDLGFDKADTVYVGDRSVDRDAAKDAGVRYIPEHRFF